MRKAFIVALSILLLTLLSACGSSNSENESEASNSNSDVSDTTQPQEIVIEGVNGKVTLDAPAKKVVALEFTYAEDLIALGLQPVGMADIEGYKKWVNIDEPLSDDVVDVGTRNEPNFELISSLNPDLIIGIAFRHESILTELEQIAPTVLFNPYPSEDDLVTQYDEMLNTFREIATATGTEEQAETVLSEMETRQAEVKEKIEQADLNTNKFILTLGYTSSEAPTFRIFTPNAMASDLMTRIGLENAYESETFEVYGYSEVNLEALTNLEEANFFYIIQDDDPMLETLSTNPVWNNLSFVKNGQMYSLGGDAWPYGGPLSSLTFLKRIENALRLQ